MKKGDFGEPLFIEENAGLRMISARGDDPFPWGVRVPTAYAMLPAIPKLDERVVACVNACAGIPTAALTAHRPLLAEAAEALIGAADWIANIENGRYVVEDDARAVFGTRDRTMVMSAAPNTIPGPNRWRALAALLKGESA